MSTFKFSDMEEESKHIYIYFLRSHALLRCFMAFLVDFSWRREFERLLSFEMLSYECVVVWKPAYLKGLS